MKGLSTSFLLESEQLRLSAQMVPWDEAVFGYPVVEINALSVGDYLQAKAEYAVFQEWLRKEQVRLVSCRLPHTQLQESFFLESMGFCFVEMVLHPQKGKLSSHRMPKKAKNICIVAAEEADIPALQDIAQHAFRYERYHADPRIDTQLAGKRYANWVRNASNHSSQQLLKIMDADLLLGFFVVEATEKQSVYWHLTAIAPERQGIGYGRLVWNAMLNYHRQHGFEAVRTTISARNIEVLNLYSKLQFRFAPPEMTFHWMGDAD
ncbi:MAG: GNAT family N-acetyltransferase [bacterium]|nr:GNAT family N-acetyltransferase [bacterium]